MVDMQQWHLLQVSRRDINVTACKILLLLIFYWISYVSCSNYLIPILKFCTIPVHLHDVTTFLYARLQTGSIMVWWCPSVLHSVRLSVRVSVRPFSALFSYMLWHIELKFCTWLCFNVLQVKFECRHFALIFEGVMPLCELRM